MHDEYIYIYFGAEQGAEVRSANVFVTGSTIPLGAVAPRSPRQTGPKLSTHL